MISKEKTVKKAIFHLPGLFEFYKLYEIFLPIFYEHREYFYDWCEIGSIYGAPSDSLWGGGRVGFGNADSKKVFELTQKYDISARLTFSNSLLKEEHLLDKKCNKLCEEFNNTNGVRNGVIVYSDLLLNYIKEKYTNLYLVSSTTKVITEFDRFVKELERDDFNYVVADFRLNKEFGKLENLSHKFKEKVEFLCNECCYIGCNERKKCYENVSYKSIGMQHEEHICMAADANDGYRFSKAMQNPSFIGIDSIKNIYLPMDYNNFKIEGRGLGSAIVFELLLYYLTKPEYQINVREKVYLDNMLDLF